VNSSIDVNGLNVHSNYVAAENGSFAEIENSQIHSKQQKDLNQ